MSLRLQKLLPKNEELRLKKLTEIEGAARLRGYKCIAGVDEAGRGPLAGPIVAAACSIDEGIFFAGINDSKLLLPKKRKTLFDQISQSRSVDFGIGTIDALTIDRINIFQATLEAMRLALQGMRVAPDCLLVDGKHVFTDKIYSEPIVKGDRLSQMIAAASILAKVTRDTLMLRYHEEYPEYNFQSHKGYGTAQHYAAIEKHGLSPIHRRSFLTRILV